MPNHDNEQANAWRRVLYAQNKYKNNKKQRLLYKAARLPVDMSSSISLTEPLDIASLPSVVPNPLKNHLNDAHQCFHKKMDQLADMNVCSICKESYPGIATKKFHGVYACSHCILERKGHRFSLENNMDPGNQPTALVVLTQVE